MPPAKRLFRKVLTDPSHPQPRVINTDQARVAPILVLKYNIRTRSLADQGAIEDVLAVENNVVPFDRADVLEQGCVNAFLGDSPRAHRLRDLLGLPIDDASQNQCQAATGVHLLV